MPQIPQTFIDDVLSRIDIVELIDARVKLKKIGVNYRALCPFHNEKTPSFTVNPSKQIFHCFGCGEGGNAIGFLMRYDRMEFVETMETLAAKVGLSIPQQTTTPQHSYKHLYPLLDKVQKFYQAQLKTHTQAINYLKSRELTGKIVKQFQVGFAPPEWDALLKQFPQASKDLLTSGMLIQNKNGRLYDRFRDRIIFPIRDTRGRVIGFGGRTMADAEPKYLNSPETPTFHKGIELYGLYEALQANKNLKQFIIVEGYMDVIALNQHGINNCGATLGTATSHQHLQKIFRFTENIVFSFDGDDAGKKAAWRALEIALPLMRDGLSLSFMFLPQGEDPDSFVRKFGKEKFIEACNNALQLTDFFISELEKQVDINSINGKAKLAELARSYLFRMPNGVFKELLLERINKLVGTDITKSHTKQIPTELPLTKTSMLTPMRLVIALLLQNPGLHEAIDLSELHAINVPGSEMLAKLIELIKSSPSATTASLIEYFRNSKYFKLANQLAALEFLIPDHGLRQELIGAMQKLKQLACEQQIKILLAKAGERGLSQAEKKTLQGLIASKN